MRPRAPAKSVLMLTGKVRCFVPKQQLVLKGRRRALLFRSKLNPTPMFSDDGGDVLLMFLFINDLMGVEELVNWTAIKKPHSCLALKVI